MERLHVVFCIVWCMLINESGSFIPFLYLGKDSKARNIKCGSEHPHLITRTGDSIRFQQSQKRTKMLFSVPDVENLLFAPSDRRFFNPVWYPYFARQTYVEKLQLPSSGNPFWRTEESNIWMFEQPIGFFNISVNIRSVFRFSTKILQIQLTAHV